MTFFKEEKRNAADAEAEVWAGLLHGAMLRAGRTAKKTPTQLRTWQHPLRKLANKHGKELFEKTLYWYTEHLTDEYVPVCTGIGSFSDKFDRVLKAMIAEEGPTISRRAERTVELFRQDYKLPVEIDGRLPAVVQTTFDNWDAFSKKMRETAVPPTPTREVGFIHRILSFHAPVFPWNWLVHLHSRLGGLRSYAGPVAQLAFRPQAKAFRETFWHGWADEWCGAAVAFDPLLARLTQE